MNKDEKAIGYFRNKFNCAQSTFTVFGQDYGLSENDCLKVSCGFGAGMGRQQLTCGAVTGAMMALGMRFGKALNDPEENKSETYNKTRQLFNEFAKINGSTSCRQLLNGLDMNDPDDLEIIKKLGLFQTSCEKYVGDAVRIAEKLIG